MILVSLDYVITLHFCLGTPYIVCTHLWSFLQFSSALICFILRGANFHRISGVFQFAFLQKAALPRVNQFLVNSLSRYQLRFTYPFNLFLFLYLVRFSWFISSSSKRPSILNLFHRTFLWDRADSNGYLRIFSPTSTPITPQSQFKVFDEPLNILSGGWDSNPRPRLPKSNKRRCWMILLQESFNTYSNQLSYLPIHILWTQMGLEPTTTWLPVRCSSNWTTGPIWLMDILIIELHQSV